MKCFIGVIATIAMFNLNEDEFESHFLKDGRRAFVVDAKTDSPPSFDSFRICSCSHILFNTYKITFL